VTQVSFEAVFGSSGAPVGDLFSFGADPRLEALTALKQRMVQFASGLSRVRDFGTAAWAGHAVGVEIGEMSEAALQRLAEVVIDYRIAAFVDSGAFGVFMRGLRGGPCKPLDFGQVLSAYERFTGFIHDYNAAEETYPAPLLVMPDIVGDQLGSLDLVIKHRAWIRTACFFSGVCRPIIPIQRGPLDVADVHARIVDALGTDAFVVGIPSNAAAFSPTQFTSFLTTAQPRAVHILGAFADSRVTPRLNQILDSGLDNDIAVSADANPLRSIIIERGQGADGRRDRLAGKLGTRARREALMAYVKEQGGIESLREHLLAYSDDRRHRVVSLLSDYSELPASLIAQRLGLPGPQAAPLAA
jgi:hypothetical protein